MTAAPRLAMVAGEASGDLLAGLLLDGLKRRWPQLRASGIGGPQMARRGFDAWWPSDKLAVRGYFEAVRHLPEIIGIRVALGRRLDRRRPDAFVGVDAPDFNLGLEKRLKRTGVKTIHFVSPSIWAWRGGRIDAIAAAVDHMLCVFPFEPAIYARKGIAATYVGHPLADAIPLVPPREASRAALGLSPGDEVIALLPGSRRSEIDHIAPLFVAAAAAMRRERPGLRLLLPAAPGLRAAIEALLRAAPTAGIELLDGRSHEALAACDAALVASGTATLEAALFKRPMVIAYRVNAWSYRWMKGMNYQPWIGLPNILLGEFAVPEILQDAATPAALSRATLDWLDDPSRVAALQARFVELHHLLRRDTARLATDAIALTLGR